MRQPNGQMSKKDRRACQAFGLPSTAPPSTTTMTVTLGMDAAPWLTSLNSTSASLGSLTVTATGSLMYMGQVAQNAGHQMVTLSTAWQRI